MLPWDVWGLGWEPPEQPTSEMLASFDAIAALTVDPDHGLDDLLDRYESDPSFRMHLEFATLGVHHREGSVGRQWADSRGHSHWSAGSHTDCRSRATRRVVLVWGRADG